ncbi:MAG: DUF167 domain-containing protein [Proteobacteria bacterium]|nr:DUF167 domain-containing protein [Pseudomonadota bacterium]
MNIEIKVITNAKKRGVVREGIGLKVRLTSLPVEGKANEELIGYLSDIFNVKRSEVKIVRGDKDKRKLVSIPVDEAAIERVAGKTTTVTTG